MHPVDINMPGRLEKCEGAIPHFWAEIAPNHTILNLLFRTFGPKLHFFSLFGENRISLKQNRTFFKFFLHFSRSALICNDTPIKRPTTVQQSFVNDSYK